MSKILSSAEANHINQLVEEAENIVITSHKSPDGDAIGSALGLFHILKNKGKKPIVILPDDVPAFIQWMDGYAQIVIFQKENEKAKELISNAQLIFSLDYNNLSRVGNEMENALRATSAQFILIDHHQQPEDFAVVTYSDTSSCSTAQLIYKVAEACGWKSFLDIASAEAIYTGIMTDSGSFRFPSVTQETHFIVGELIGLGMKHALIHQRIYDTNSLDKLHLIGYALSEKLEVLEDCATAIVSLSLEEMERFNHQPGDTESLVNQALSIKGVNLSVFFREDSEKVKISFRSKGNVDVNRLAREEWNGGGHFNAAGGSYSKPLDVAIERFKAQCYTLKNEIFKA